VLNRHVSFASGFILDRVHMISMDHLHYIQSYWITYIHFYWITYIHFYGVGAILVLLFPAFFSVFFLENFLFLTSSGFVFRAEISIFGSACLGAFEPCIAGARKLDLFPDVFSVPPDFPKNWSFSPVCLFSRKKTITFV
jgi:hypothetical protein